MVALTVQPRQSNFENVEHALDKLADLRERWINRLTVKNLSLAKRYLKGELCVVIRWFIGPGNKECRAILKRELPVSRAQRERREGNASKIGERLTELRRHVDCQVTVSGPYRYDSLVFVEDIELVKSPKGFVPTLVWFQVLDNPPRLGAGPLYVSGEGLFKFLFAFPNDEMDMVEAGSRGVTVSDNFDHEQVKRGPGVVDHITNDGAPFGRNRALEANFVIAASSARILINKDFVGLAGSEGLNLCGKLPDVAFGPFDL